MAIEFRCAQCGRLLRTADDTAGKPAQCPECGAITTIPVPGAAIPPTSGSAPESPFAAGGGGAAGAGGSSPFGPSGPQAGPAGEPQNPYQSPTQYGTVPTYAGVDPTAASRVGGPATALIVTAGLGIAMQVIGLIAHLAQFGFQQHMHAGGPDAMMFSMLNSGIGLISGAVGIIIGLVIIVGAMKMKNLESYSFAMAAAIIAMIPCISPCCVLGLPFGIWALVVLNDPTVKAAFRG
jgi:phage FluMu protein Com